jgi:amino acid permease
MASRRPLADEKHEPIPSHSGIEKDPYDVHPDVLDATEHQHVVADKLARKLSARQVQMIAIGTFSSCRVKDYD